MAKSKVVETEMKEYKWKGNNHHGMGGGIYGAGFLGAAVYFIQRAPDFQTGAIGVLKAAVWPALFVYKVLELLKF